MSHLLGTWPDAAALAVEPERILPLEQSIIRICIGIGITYVVVGCVMHLLVRRWAELVIYSDLALAFLLVLLLALGAATARVSRGGDGAPAPFEEPHPHLHHDE